ncbi:MAG TPA: Nif3-like dinuclear metal center hexameric protein [bacterium]|nr:Nif3-like dinuclear metal center hexameric protein [bacterium]
MIKLERIVGFLNSYLDISGIRDGSWNGLQFEGKEVVKRVMCSVDAGAIVFEEAAKRRADIVVVHHGNYWADTNPCFTGLNKKRMDILYKNGISLYAAHLPLDKHPEIGNNAMLLRMIGAKIFRDFFIYDGQAISYCGHYKKAENLDSIVDKINKGLGIKCRVLPFGKKLIQTVAVISGGGGYAGFNEAVKAGVDLYITGDAIEIFHNAKDSGINVIFGGHHATETLGVKQLAKLISKDLDVEAEFVDIPTGL